MRKLLALGLTLGILLVAGTLWAVAGRSSEARPQQADANATWAAAGGDSQATPQSAGTTATVIREEEFLPITQEIHSLIDPSYLPVSAQTKHSDVIVVGKVVKVDPARWNSPDGKDWIPADSMVMRVIFRTFWVQPTEVLKGKPTAGEPLPFFVRGGTEGEASAPVGIGDTVLVFGREASRNPAQDGYWPEGYRVNIDEYSIFEPDGDHFTNGSTDPLFGITTLDQVRRLVEFPPITQETENWCGHP